MPYRILVTSRTYGKTDERCFEMLEESGCEVVINPYGRLLTEEELKQLLPDIDGVIAGLDPFNQEVLEGAPKLKVISRYGVGFNNVDIEAATECGIVVTNTPGANSSAVAELAFGLMLDVARRISTSDRMIREGVWGKFTGTEIWGKTIGIVGTGQIGKELARRAKGFSMNILCYDLYPDYDWARQLGAEYVDFPRLLKEADFISFHLPMSEDTYHMVSEEEINLMKPDAILINAARGGIIDEKALYDALKNNRIAGAGLDLSADEYPAGVPLTELDNLVMTSHIGAHTKEAITAMSRLATENLILVIKGERPKYVINPDVYRTRKN